jgi:uncharacterized protein (DUF433 family)
VWAPSAASNEAIFKMAFHNGRAERRAMALQIKTEPVPLTTDKFGVVRVGGTRVALDLVINAHKEGATPQEIAERFTSLRLPDIYAAISYYLRHQAEVEAYLTQREQLAEAIRQEIEAKPNPVRDRLCALRAQRQGVNDASAGGG